MTHNINNSPINNSLTPVTGYRTEEERRRTDAPNSRKDFKRVLAKSKADDENDGRKVADQDAEGIEESDEDSQKGTSRSLFDLSASKKSASAFSFDDDEVATNSSQNTKKDFMETASGAAIRGKDAKLENPSSGKMTKAGKKESSSSLSEENAIAAERDVNAKSFDDHSTDADAGGGGSSNLYTAEQGDLSYVNPLAASMQTTAVEGRFETNKIQAVDMQKIIDQLVDSVKVIERQGQSDTVITLKEPPMFAGANLIVTSFDSAHKELNIAFENLTQAAQNLLSQQVNKDSLLHGLEQKGYAVHILTATTTNTVAVAAPQPQEDRQRQNDERREQRQGQRQQQQGEQ